MSATIHALSVTSNPPGSPAPPCGTSTVHPGPLFNSPAAHSILQSDPNPRWTLRAHRLLINWLRGFGNKPSYAHQLALLELLSGFTKLAKGVLRGRHAFPLHTGMGKTLAIVAWIKAVHDGLGLGTVSVAVVASKVEALCQLKRDLIQRGVSASAIGLLHSYEHDASWKPGADLKDGFASEPSDSNAPFRPILLVTHERAKKQPCFVDGVLGRRRDLIIWDESLIASEPRAVRADDLQDHLNVLHTAVTSSSATGRFIDEFVDLLKSEIDQQARGAAPKELAFPACDLAEIETELRELERSRLPEIRALAVRGFRNLLEMNGTPFTLMRLAPQSGIISFRQVVPAQLTSVAILDASSPIRELVRLDSSITESTRFSHGIKRFDRVCVNYFSAASGRDAVEKDLASTDPGGRRFARFVVEAARHIPPNEAAIIFTFRARLNLDCAAVIRAELQDAGIDPDECLPDGRRRFVFLTWGNETSLSEFSYCTHVIFAGVLFLPRLDLAAHISGQSGRHVPVPTHDEIGRVETSEVAHRVLQAMSRGQMRRVDDHQAEPMTAWLPMRDERIRPILERILPGLVWRRCNSVALATGRLADALADDVREYLAKLPASAKRISCKRIKLALPQLRTVSRDVAAEAIRMGAANAAWRVNGRTAERLQGASRWAADRSTRP